MKEYDYCIIGVGLDGLIFADSILTHSDRTIAIIDPPAKSAKPRPRDALAISRALSDNRIGLNGYTLRDWRSEFHKTRINRPPTAVELHAYAEHVLEQRLTSSGRLERLRHVGYLGNNRFRSHSTVTPTLPVARRSIVQTVPASHGIRSSFGRSFTVATQVHVVKPNILLAHAEMKHRTFDQYCVIGSGKVGTEMILALIDLDIPVDKIKWVKPRESWMLAPPAASQTSSELASIQRESLKAMANARNATDLGQHLEHLGILKRATDDQIPSHFLPHVISPKDAIKLRRIKGVIRKGHVHAISEIGMVLSHGAVPMPRRTLYLDCTGRGEHRSRAQTIFAEKHIELSPVRLSHPSFSASLIGAIELLDLNTAEKNALCAPINNSNLAFCFLTALLNHHAWFYNRDVRLWLETSRLDPALQATALQLNRSEHVPEDLAKIRAILPRAIVNLESLVEQSGAVDPLRA